METLIGAHTSSAGGVHNALYRGQEIGATTIQLFTRNQKQWRAKPFSEEELTLWFEALEKTQLKKIMCHDSYLINLGSPNDEVLVKSREAFKQEILRCKQLQLSYLNFHPGSALKESPQKCLDTIIDSLLLMKPYLENSSLVLLLETTAGQGSNVGYLFEHLSYILSQTQKQIPIGVCIDTCHIFAAGYDIRGYQGWNQVIDQFDKEIGIDHLYALHVNDSKKEFGSRRDRHELLGQGEIKIESFEAMMRHPKLQKIPKYLETPGGMEIWPEEIKLLKSFCESHAIKN
jgi:deoxyribonuclease-4